MHIKCKDYDKTSEMSNNLQKNQDEKNILYNAQHFLFVHQTHLGKLIKSCDTLSNNFIFL